MISVYGWHVSVVLLESLHIQKCCFPFKFFKISEFAVQHFNITTQLLSVRPLIFDPADPDCEKEEILRNITSVMTGASVGVKTDDRPVYNTQNADLTLSICVVILKSCTANMLIFF
jgi:hypothetical protein